MSSPTPDRLQSRAEQARARAARSRLVLRGSIVVGVLVVGAFVVETLLRHTPAPEAPAAMVDKAPVMSGGVSTYSGIDDHSQPFDVRAQEGVQDAQVETLMHLKVIDGNFQRHQGGTVAVTGDTAEYDVKSKDLNLHGNVTFEEPGHYIAYLKSAAVNLERQKIVTKEPVQLKTGGATIFADRMETSEDGKSVVLTGNVKAHFDQGPPGPDDQ